MNPRALLPRWLLGRWVLAETTMSNGYFSKLNVVKLRCQRYFCTQYSKNHEMLSVSAEAEEQTYAQHPRHGRDVQTKEASTDTCERAYNILR